MQKFNVTILGCGSALPTTRHNPTSQIVNHCDKLYMIDCGEGTQLQMRKNRIKFSRLNHIFISHLHGDHYFGLPGLLSTYGMMKRTAQLHIYAHKDLEILLKDIILSFSKNSSYEILFHTIDPTKKELICEDRSIKVYTIPLKHRIPCCGFLFEEKERPLHLNKPMTDYYKVPLYQLNLIKNGADYTKPDGEVIENKKLTLPATPIRRYAYCSDTIYLEKIIPQIQGVDLLFHEATFAEEESARAKETFHTTAKQAATIAWKAKVKKLIIGHFSARYTEDTLLKTEAIRIFNETSLANEGDSYEI